ncbi:hypothetical protein CEXT_323221 [Caerostris extrusa]|uniref:Uncharacterized protein n=1 Tax=Caerostris extrusa TaxID=172846 RepID=A0AAV4N5D6_CAEEX|nr:hypothetical protein CEXT_323221 [Caerostris extrusa]
MDIPARQKKDPGRNRVGNSELLWLFLLEKVCIHLKLVPKSETSGMIMLLVGCHVQLRTQGMRIFSVFFLGGGITEIIRNWVTLHATLGHSPPVTLCDLCNGIFSPNMSQVASTGEMSHPNDMIRSRKSEKHAKKGGGGIRVGVGTPTARVLNYDSRLRAWMSQPDSIGG